MRKSHSLFRFIPLLICCMGQSPCDPPSEGLGKPAEPDGDMACKYFCEDLDLDGSGGGNCNYYNCSTDHGDEGTTDSPPDDYAPYGDCNDRDPDINPDAEEVCDGEDNDCSGSVDDDAVDAETYMYDDDDNGICDRIIRACPEVTPPSDKCIVTDITPGVGR